MTAFGAQQTYMRVISTAAERRFRSLPLTTIEPRGLRRLRSFANVALIILIENNMVARADHGMIGLGRMVPMRSTNEPDARQHVS